MIPVKISVPVGPFASNRLGLSMWRCAGMPTRDFRWQREFYHVERSGFSPAVIDEIAIRKWYNFGNAVRQLLNALSFAKLHDIKRVQVPPSNWLTGCVIEGIEVVVVPRRRNGATLVGTFFYPETIGIAWDSQERAAFLKGIAASLVPPLSSVESSGEDVLTIHLRSGDVFGCDPHPGYWPPPLSYFKACIADADVSFVRIVAQDLNHPYLHHLEKWCAVQEIEMEIRCSDLTSDLRTLLGARKLCLSQGTMGLAVAWLSRCVTEVYLCDNSETSELAALGYEIRNMKQEGNNGSRGSWRATEGQISQLLGSDRDTWSPSPGEIQE